MAADITVTPASPRATIDHVRVEVTGADPNDDTAFDANAYPTAPEFRYYLLFDNPDGDDGKSYIFNVSQDGKHTFNSYVFPNDGSWTVRLRDASDDSDVATEAVTVT